MARFVDHEKAIILRKQGKSYSQIKKILKVSKSTLSYWLRDYPLSDQRLRELRDWNEQRIEKYRATRLRQKKERIEKIYKEEKKICLSRNEIYLLLVCFYIGARGQRLLLLKFLYLILIRQLLNFLSSGLRKF